MTGLDLRDLIVAFGAGYAVGHRAAEDQMAVAWSAAAGPIRAALAQPLHAVLQARRDQPRSDPCLRCDHRSSCCVRVAAVERNRERYGDNNYPGQWQEVPHEPRRRPDPGIG